MGRSRCRRSPAQAGRRARRARGDRGVWAAGQARRGGGIRASCRATGRDARVPASRVLGHRRPPRASASPASADPRTSRTCSYCSLERRSPDGSGHQPRPARLGRLERPALTGVLVREVVNYSSYWKSSTFIDGRADDLSPGVRIRVRLDRQHDRRIRLRRFRRHRNGRDGGAVLQRVRGDVRRSSSTSSSTRTTRSWRRPSTPRSSSTPRPCGWRRGAGVYGCVPMLVAIVFGLEPSWGMFVVPFIAWIAGYGWGVLRDLGGGLLEVARELQLRRVPCSPRCSCWLAVLPCSTSFHGGRRSSRR